MPPPNDGSEPLRVLGSFQGSLEEFQESRVEVLVFRAFRVFGGGVWIS